MWLTRWVRSLRVVASWSPSLSRTLRVVAVFNVVVPVPVPVLMFGVPILSVPVVLGLSVPVVIVIVVVMVPVIVVPPQHPHCGHRPCLVPFGVPILRVPVLGVPILSVPVVVVVPTCCPVLVLVILIILVMVVVPPSPSPSSLSRTLLCSHPEHPRCPRLPSRGRGPHCPVLVVLAIHMMARWYTITYLMLKPILSPRRPASSCS